MFFLHIVLTMLPIQELVITNFEFLMFGETLFWKLSKISLHLIILDGNHFSIFSVYEHTMLWFTLKKIFFWDVLELRFKLGELVFSMLLRHFILGFISFTNKTYSKLLASPSKFRKHTVETFLICSEVILFFYML